VVASAPAYFDHYVTVTFNILPPPSDVARLDFQLSYNSSPIPRGPLSLTNTFTNRGAALITVTNLAFYAVFGSSSSSQEVPFNLTSGQSRIVTVTTQVPLTTTFGNQTVLAKVEWSYYAPAQGRWFQGPTKYASGSISVSQNPLSGPFRAMGQLTGLLGGVAPWFLVAYCVAASFGAFLVIRNDRKKQMLLNSR